LLYAGYSLPVAKYWIRVDSSLILDVSIEDCRFGEKDSDLKKKSLPEVCTSGFYPSTIFRAYRTACQASQR